MNKQIIPYYYKNGVSAVEDDWAINWTFDKNVKAIRIKDDFEGRLD